MTSIRVVDLFCGAGGSSTGALRALRALGLDLDLIVVNHWPVAVATHSRNHPEARHYCVDVDTARPEALVPEGRLDLLMASPECTHFSRARGGQPVHDQRRMGAWRVQEWASKLDIACILIENVPEFLTWGPVDPETGKPVKALKGTYFFAWRAALEAMGYVTDYRFLNAADYGDATTRVRFFLQARKDGRPIRWPEPTHAQQARADMFGELERWRPAREILDLDQPGKSIFTRKRPLAVNTRLRIAAGAARFWGPLAPYYIDLLDLPEDKAAALRASASTGEPRSFVSAMRKHTGARPVDEPMPTITAGAVAGGMALVEPVIEPFVLGQQSDAAPRPVDEPLPTIATAGAISLTQPVATPYVFANRSNNVPRSVEEPAPAITTTTGGGLILTSPVILPYYGTSAPDGVDQPLATVTGKARFGLAQPVLITTDQTGGNGPYVRPMSAPLPTLHTKANQAIATPVIVPYGPRADLRSGDEPLPTILTKDRLAVATPTAAPFLIPHFGERAGQAPRVHTLDAPLPAVTSHGAGALVEPFLVTINHGGHDGRAQTIDAPLPTVTAKRGVALVEPVTQLVSGDVDPRRLVWIDGTLHVLDILYRMLSNRELARAMGFDDAEAEYEFTGTVADVTKQIGNAVSVATARALVTAIFAPATTPRLSGVA